MVISDFLKEFNPSKLTGHRIDIRNNIIFIYFIKIPVDTSIKFIDYSFFKNKFLLIYILNIFKSDLF